MKKLFTLILMMGMLALMSITALAESDPTDTEVKEAKVTVPENIIVLKDTIKALNEDMKGVRDSIKDTRSTRKEDFKSQAGEIKETIATKRESNKTLREEYALVKENFMSLKARLTEQVKEAREAGDTEKAESLKAEIKAATLVFEATKADYLSKKVSFEDEKLAFENLRSEYKALKDEVLPYIEAIKERHTQVVSLREEAKSAFSNQDFDTVANLLTEILGLKEANYNDMLTIQSLVQ